MERKEKYLSKLSNRILVLLTEQTNRTQPPSSRRASHHQGISFSYRTKRKLNYPVPIVPMKSDHRRKERRGEKYFVRCENICLVSRPRWGGEILKGRRSVKIQRPPIGHREHTVWGIFEEPSPIEMQAVLNCIWHKLFRIVWEIRGLATAA